MATKDTKPYVDFYKKHEISPVSQDITDIQKHFDRREFLYRRLGIVPAFVEGKKVLEFGPGSGHNALYPCHLNPSKYVLVDGNPTGLKECEKLLTRHFPNSNIEYVESMIEEFKTDEVFDLVICEGLIPAQKNPKQFLQTIAKFVKPGGVCTITCHDSVGYFTDFLRCLIGILVINEKMTFDEKVETLVAVFGKHLNTLKGMSRPHDDWVIDTILNTSLWRGDNLLSFEDAIDALDSEFDIYGTSPFYVTDWRWYKDVYGEQKLINDIGKKCFKENVHNFLDYRFTFSPRAVEENERLLSLCDELWQIISLFGKDRSEKHIKEFCRKGYALEKMIRLFSEETANAFLDFILTLEKYPNIDKSMDWGRFASWWGRGMPYASFIRNWR